MAGEKGSKHYSLELKLEATRMFYEEGKTRKEITEALGIRDRNRVMKWLRQYRREGEAGSRAVFTQDNEQNVRQADTDQDHPDESKLG